MRRRRDLPSLDLIRGFEAAARHSSFTRAAQELFVTQSAISRQVKQLEDELGIPLFRRENRALFLTDAGRLLLRTASEMMQSLDDALDRLPNAGQVRHVTVTTTLSLSSTWLVPRLPRFRQRYPDIDVHVHASNDFVDLERQHVDLAIRLCEPAKAPQGSVPMMGEEVFPVCSPALLRDRDRPIREPRDLERHVLLHFDEAAGRWPEFTWEHWLRSAGVAGLRSAGSFGFSHYDQVLQAAAAGSGVAIGRTPLVADLLARRVLVAPFRKRERYSRAYFVVRSADSGHRPAVDAFASWLIEEVHG